MNRKNLVIGAVMLLAALAAASSVGAQTVGAHPALRGSAPVAAVGIDPNTFIVGHPAGLTFVRGHANHEHPAVAAKRDAAGQPGPDGDNVTAGAGRPWLACRGVSG